MACPDCEALKQKPFTTAPGHLLSMMLAVSWGCDSGSGCVRRIEGFWSRCTACGMQWRRARNELQWEALPAALR